MKLTVSPPSQLFLEMRNRNNQLFVFVFFSLVFLTPLICRQFHVGLDRVFDGFRSARETSNNREVFFAVKPSTGFGKVLRSLF